MFRVRRELSRYTPAGQKPPPAVQDIDLWKREALPVRTCSTRDRRAAVYDLY